MAGNRPEFRSINRFRQQHLETFSKLFVEIVRLTEKMGLVKLGTVALDGTKIKANASKHKAMSCQRMKEDEQRLEKEIQQLLEEAQQTGAAEDELHGADNSGEELPLGEPAAAQPHFNKTLTRCRRINLVELEPSILLVWARLRQDREPAQRALAIADRCEYRLDQPDIHNFLARLALDSGKPAEAREHAQKAKDCAYCDAPPHYYKPAYEEAKRLLIEATQAQGASA